MPRIEYKPGLRKARGVYYTPSYIVDYMVGATLEPLLAGHTPSTAASLSILDLACGDGAFLLGAYQYLLDWHLRWYLEHRVPLLEDAEPSTSLPVCRGARGEWCLSTAERERILVNNIHGVDIDPRAVEAARLSLASQSNIHCGNALHGLDWNSAFPEVMRRGGFDVVIGNPPYRRERDYKREMDEIAATAFGRKYRSARMDLWYYFMHRGLELLKSGGRLSFIVNSYWVAGSGAEKLIAALERDCHVEEIFSLGKLKVFPDVTGQHMILRLRKGGALGSTVIKVPAGNALTAKPFFSGRFPVDTFEKPHDQLFHEGRIDIERPTGALDISTRGRPLEQFGMIRQGIAENPAQINAKTQQAFPELDLEVGEGVFTLTPGEVARLRLPKREQALLRPYFDLRDLGRYWRAPTPSLSLIYSTKQTWPEEDRYPRLRDHLARFRPIMERRRETMSGSNRWWHLHWPRDPALWTSPKLVSIQMGKQPSFVPVSGDVYTSFSTNVFIPHASTREHLWYFAALLNSRLLFAWFMHNAKRRGANLELNIKHLKSSPIRPIAFDNPAERESHDRLVQLVGTLLDLTQRRATARTPHEATTLERALLGAEQAMDRIVYALYHLTPGEVAAVESATARPDMSGE
jgi:adenine-specific DNA-methyltransferase